MNSVLYKVKTTKYIFLLSILVILHDNGISLSKAVYSDKMSKYNATRFIDSEIISRGQYETIKELCLGHQNG